MWEGNPPARASEGKTRVRETDLVNTDTAGLGRQRGILIDEQEVIRKDGGRGILGWREFQKGNMVDSVNCRRE